MSEQLNNSNVNNSENNSNFGNANNQNRIENLLFVSLLSPNNISSFQNFSYYASPKTPDNLNQSSISKTSEQNESSKQQNNLDSNNKEEESETPKMCCKLFQNTQNIKMNNNSEKESNNTETKYTSNILNHQKQITPIPVIQNIVSTADLGCPINLKEIALQAENTQYAPNKFSGLIMRIKKPKATALIFATGKMVCLGAKTEEESKNACKIFGKILINFKYPITLKNFKIQNIVSSCDVKFKIPLSKLNNHIIKYLGAKRISYEPEVFPGLIYHYYNDIDNNSEENGGKSNIVFLIFSSGNIVIAGAKNRNEIYDKFDKLFPLLDKFRDNKK